MTIEDFEELISDHVYASLDYATTQTCSRKNYDKLEDLVFATKGKLLDKIEHLITNQK